MLTLIVALQQIFALHGTSASIFCQIDLDIAQLDTSSHAHKENINITPVTAQLYS